MYVTAPANLALFPATSYFFVKKKMSASDVSIASCEKIPKNYDTLIGSSGVDYGKQYAAHTVPRISITQILF